MKKPFFLFPLLRSTKVYRIHKRHTLWTHPSRKTFKWTNVKLTKLGAAFSIRLVPFSASIRSSMRRPRSLSISIAAARLSFFPISVHVLYTNSYSAMTCPYMLREFYVICPCSLRRVRYHFEPRPSAVFSLQSPNQVREEKKRRRNTLLTSRENAKSVVCIT